MAVIGSIEKGYYFDSVTLMRLSRELTKIPGVMDASLVMGTEANKSILTNSGLYLDAFDPAGDSDVIIALKTDESRSEAELLDSVRSLFQSPALKPVEKGKHSPSSLDSALKELPGANLVLISVAGRYAGRLAFKALRQGCHVMLFSDNVDVKTEKALKEYAGHHGLLVMGPDCGTAIINGVPLGFANAVRRGDIGIVAASGTGLQETSCIISNYGGGISQAIGTGGRDGKREIGGLMLFQALDALENDPETSVILLISKPLHPEVAAALKSRIDRIRKPVVPLFLGAPDMPGNPRTLEEAAFSALAISKKVRMEDFTAAVRSEDEKILRCAEDRLAILSRNQKYIRGLYSGGTFCTESQIILKTSLNDLYSNTPIEGVHPLKATDRSIANTVIDLGDDAFTVGRPHPMIDYMLRLQALEAEASDPETAIVVIDVVLGYGAHPDPASELEPVICKISQKTIVLCSVTGTPQDPQHRDLTAARLRDSGAFVFSIHASACRAAAHLATILQQR